MTDTSGANAPAGPVFPPGRYGRRREPAGRRHRLAVVGGAVAAAAAALAVGVKGYQEFGDPLEQPEVITYTDVAERSVTIHFRVHLRAGQGAVCLLRARARDGSVVGQAEVAVPAGQPVQRYVLATGARPFVGEALRCRTS